jgi:hypothetical protein
MNLLYEHQLWIGSGEQHGTVLKVHLRLLLMALVDW